MIKTKDTNRQLIRGNEYYVFEQVLGRNCISLVVSPIIFIGQKITFDVYERVDNAFAELKRLENDEDFGVGV